MQVGHLELFARDPAKTADFYLHVIGCQPVVQQPGDLHWVALKDQEMLIRPARGVNPVVDRYDDSALAIVLYTDGLDKAVERLKAAGVEFGRPDGGARCFTFRDPDGRWIQLVDPAERI